MRAAQLSSVKLFDLDRILPPMHFTSDGFHLDSSGLLLTFSLLKKALHIVETHTTI